MGIPFSGWVAVKCMKKCTEKLAQPFIARFQHIWGGIQLLSPLRIDQRINDQFKSSLGTGQSMATSRYGTLCLMRIFILLDVVNFLPTYLSTLDRLSWLWKWKIYNRLVVWTFFWQLKVSRFAGILRFFSIFPWVLRKFLSFWTIIRKYCEFGKKLS